MNLYNLGHVPWLDSQLIYHALPRLGLEGLILLAPAEPYVCIGYHQDARQEVDLAYCREHGIPVFRREVGGGAVYLDGQQLFYQLVIHKDNPLAPRDKTGFYRTFLEPVVQSYRDLGVNARFKPVNDIVTETGRKISGNGAAEIDDHAILVGNLIAKFDYETMVRVLRVPDAKFRDKVFKSLRENLTTLERELGQAPPWDTMVAAVVRNLETVLGPLTPAELPQSVRDEAAELAQTHTTEEWLLKPGRHIREEGRVKIADGVEVAQRVHKAPGGLIRATVETRHGQIVAASLSGDFFFYPAEKLADLERHLAGAAIAQVPDLLQEFYRSNGIESPGMTPEDLAIVLGAASAP
ncbi:MAG: lipoyl protein ligase domain-containing protein [Anaerolineae bacterium]